MSTESKRLDEEITKLQVHLKALPPGKLIITRNQSRYKWYINDGKNLTYLPKSQRRLAEELAKKKYLSLQLKNLLQEKQAIQFYLRHHSKDSSNVEQLLCNSPFQELLAPYFQPPSNDLLQWASSPYKHNMNYPEQLIHKSFSGNILRSKSETIIDMALSLNKIPFRYECLLQLGDTSLFPDFTILHPHTRKSYYWEHFGMMDNPNYSKNVYTKLRLYNSYNIFPSINLITTFETKEHPLSSNLVEKIIQYYFL